MSKPRKSSTKFELVKGPPLVKPKYFSPYGTPEILDYMKQCEAREWIRRYKAKIGELGAARGRSWWEQVKDDIGKKRGKEGLDDLVRRMEQERKEGNSAGLPSTRPVPQPRQREALGEPVQDQVGVSGVEHMAGEEPTGQLEAQRQPDQTDFDFRDA